jgi:predicted DNA binding CopG/RHH family protein
MKLDKEEKNILESLDSKKMKLSKPSKKKINAIISGAKNTFKKDKRVNLRLYDHDYKGIQKKALEMGMPYQTLISTLIHRYVENELISKRNVTGI